MPRRGQDDEQAQEEGAGPSDHDAPLTSPLGKGEWGGVSQKAVQFQESFGQAAGVSLSQSHWGPVSYGHGSAFVPAVCKVIVREHL